MGTLQIETKATPVNKQVSPDIAATKVIRVQATHGWVGLQLADLWHYRDLLFFLTWRDIKVRYKQTILGATWAILVPFFTMVVFSIFFGGLAKIPSDGIPYPIWSFAALVPWTLFSNAVGFASTSLVANLNLIKKVYVPRVFIPLGPIFACVVDFFLAFFVLLVMIFFYHIPLTLNVIWLPVFFALALITTIGMGLWTSAMMVQYRDIRYTVPFLLQIWMFISPVVYSSTMITNPTVRVIYNLNPMAGVVEGFRWALLSGKTLSFAQILAQTSVTTGFQWTAVSKDAISLVPFVLSFLVAIGLFVSGAFYFRRTERNFADVI